MPSYLSVVMPMIHVNSGVYAKLLLPLDAESVVFDRRRRWTWFPSEQDAFDANLPDDQKRRPENSFRRLAGLGDVAMADGTDGPARGGADGIWYVLDFR